MLEKQVYFFNKGQKIFGILHLPEKKKKSPCIVLCHGFTGHKAEVHFLFTKCARNLAKSGFASLRFDFRGSGDSEGEFKDMSLEEEISDAIAAINFVKKQKNIDKNKIGLLGLSMGGLVSAHVVGLVKDIKSLVLLSAVARFKKLWEKKIAKRFNNKFPQNGIDIGGLLVSKKFINAVYKLDSLNLSRIREYNNPLLIIHGDKDKTVPLQDAKIYYNTSNSLRKKLIIIKNGDHGFSNLKIEKKVINIICNWFKETLK